MSTGPVITTIGALDPRLWQAVIAGGFVAAGWLFNGWQNRRAAKDLRAERLRDVHRAIYAEIGTKLTNLIGQDMLEKEAEAMRERMRNDPDFVPFISHEHGDYVFNSVIPDISVLPRRTIDPIVAHYSQIKTLNAHAEDMRGKRFLTMDQERRIAMYNDYMAMKQQLLEFGLFANAMIKAYAEGGNEAADAVAKRINSRRVVGLSDQSQGSA